ncbi:MAG: hypothetical protein EZS28_019591 [Streblomastix strix]|uniref:DH domain-containing protein n=1 Tax=Streblomastix strix TaxID=222440 RepID=A0A5J4VQM3_9EUKA|nr:MAG: hypothetical protein EZS28_019591 [Streblomastix strix]
MFEPLTSSKFLSPLDRYLPNISSNEEELQRDEEGLIIWPPENATILPLFIDDLQIESAQKASFNMNDITWLDSRKKWYGMLISNDNNTFVGKDGNEDEPVRIDVIVEEGEQFVNFNKIQLIEPTEPLPFWLMLLILIAASAIIFILTFFCIIFVCIHKYKQNHLRKEMQRVSRRNIQIQRRKFQKLLQEQELKAKQELEAYRAQQQQQSIQSIQPRKKLTKKQQRNLEKKAGLTILRALLWNRDYHAQRPAFELMRLQRNVIQELIDSEKNYVSKMEACIQYYLQPLQKLSKDRKIKVSQSQIKDIFINIEQIHKFHKLFSNELETVAKNWTVHSSVGQMFCKQAPFLKVSVEYFEKKEKASKILKELLKSNQKFSQTIDDISQQDEVNHEHLEQFLNRPVKRISEYSLLLQKLNESMFDWQDDSKHVNLASKMIDDIASFFNFCIHRKVNMEKVLDIEQQIISYNPIPIMYKLAEEAIQIELAKKQGLKLDEYEIEKIRLQWQQYFHRIRLVRPSRCFVGDIEVFQVDSNISLGRKDVRYGTVKQIQIRSKQAD